MSTCNRLDLQTLGFQLVMLQNLPDHGFQRLQITLVEVSWDESTTNIKRVNI